MRISIGHRLFASVLLAILAVAVAGILLMRHNVMNSFGEYAVNIELDRLEGLSNELAARYREQGSWDFIGASGAEPAGWIAGELRRLQQHGAAPAPAPPMPPEAPAAAESPVPSVPAPSAGAMAGPPPSPLPLPPLPLPPLPLPPPAPPAPPPETGQPGQAYTAPLDELSLYERVTLLDAAGAYVAGRRIIGAETSARRPIVSSGQTAGFLVVARPSRPGDAMASAFLAQLKDSLLAIAAGSVLLSAAAAVLLASHFRKPVLRLAEGARALSEGRYDSRIEARRSDELGDLARSFNALAQRLDQVEASRRQWVADTSHELRTPLSVLRAQLEAAQDGVRPASASAIAAMLRQVLSLNALIDQLYALARADLGELAEQRQRLDVWMLAAEQAAAFEQKMAAAGVALQLGQKPPEAMVAGDPERLRQVFSNLLENCIRYCRRGDRVALAARVDGACIEIDVDDSGPGVAAAALARLGERFYRVEGSRSREHGGAGLGLALCRRIVEAHGGQLQASASHMGGLRIRVRLPLESA